jgi:hypothetical protein
MDIPNLIIVILCLGVLIAYLKTKRYDSLQGLLITLLALSALVLKFCLRGIPDIFSPPTFIGSGILIMVFTLLLCLLLIPFRKNNVNQKFALALLPLYLLFGLLQQLLFQYLFLDSAYTLTGNLWLSIILGALFYLSFHIRPDFDTKFRIGLFILDLFWGYFYLTYHNLFWLGISHAIFGVAYYTLVYRLDPLKERLSKKTREIIPRY